MGDAPSQVTTLTTTEEYTEITFTREQDGHFSCRNSEGESRRTPLAGKIACRYCVSGNVDIYYTSYSIHEDTLFPPYSFTSCEHYEHTLHPFSN